MSDTIKIQPPSKEEWDYCAERYAFGFARLTRGSFASILRILDIEEGSHVLELGTGPGLFAHEAQRRGAELIGIDFSEKMLDIARMNAPDSTFVLGDITALEVERKWADCVIANFVLHLLVDPAVSVLEAVRSSKDGARFAATVWQSHAENPALGLFYQAAKQAGLEVPLAIQSGPALWDIDIFQRTLQRAHFAELEVRTIEWIVALKPEEWWDQVLNGTPITGRFLLSQPPELLEKIRSNYLKLAHQLPKDEDDVMLPVRAFLGTGTVSR